MNKRGAALILIFMAAAALSVLGIAASSRSINEGNLAKRNRESTQAFWLAEAGINRALYELNRDFYSSCASGKWSASLGSGRYAVDLSGCGSTTRTVASHGFVPGSSSPRAERILETVMGTVSGAPPQNFYNNVIYGAGGLTISGGANSLSGNVIYAGTLIGTPNIEPGTGALTPDSSIYPLAHLDYTELRRISQEQNNYHDATHNPAYPASFWFDAGHTKPNVVFLEGSLALKGNETIRGFFVVGGEVTYNATLGGNVSVDGCIYTRGNFTMDGGGKALNVNGGVWVGGLATLNGGVDMHYNPDYMRGISDLEVNIVTQVVSWRDTQNPYKLEP